MTASISASSQETSALVLYREWNSGLSVGLGFNQVTANQVDVEERYVDLLNGGNSEYTTASVDTPYGSFWKMEWAVKYQLGKFGIELRRRGLELITP